MSGNSNQSKNVARVLDDAAACSLKMRVEEIIPVFDEAEAACSKLISSEDQRLEIKRRVAEWKMRLFCDRDAPFNVVKILHANAVELGYTNLEIEGAIEIYFAQYCERQNKMYEARRTLLQLHDKLERELKTKNLNIYLHFKNVSEEILSRIGV